MKKAKTTVKNKKFSPSEFQDLVDRYGEDFSKWPADMGLSGEAMVDDNEIAQTIIEQAEKIRVMMQAMGSKAPSCFSDRIIKLALELSPPHLNEKNKTRH